MPCLVLGLSSIVLGRLGGIRCGLTGLVGLVLGSLPHSLSVCLGLPGLLGSKILGLLRGVSSGVLGALHLIK